jgi:hypothetical protein
MASAINPTYNRMPATILLYLLLFPLFFNTLHLHILTNFLVCVAQAKYNKYFLNLYPGFTISFWELEKSQCLWETKKNRFLKAIYFRAVGSLRGSGRKKISVRTKIFFRPYENGRKAKHTENASPFTLPLVPFTFQLLFTY